MNLCPQRVENRIAAKRMPITTIIFDYGRVLSMPRAVADPGTVGSAISRVADCKNRQSDAPARRDGAEAVGQDVFQN